MLQQVSRTATGLAALGFVFLLATSTRAQEGDPAVPPPPPPVAPEPAPGPEASPAPGNPPPPGASPGQPPPPAQPYPPGPYFPPGTAPPPATQGPPQGPFAEPPPPPPPQTGAYEHDGFLLQMGIGFGFGSLTISAADDSGGDEVSAQGFVGGIELLLGGTPVPGFVVGAGIITHALVNPTLEVGGQEFETEDSGMDAGALTLFSNFYFDPGANFYIQGLLGLGSGTWRLDGSDVAEAKPSGLLLAAGLGYGGWVSEQWALSGLARFSYYTMSDEEATGVEFQYTMFTPTLSFVATYH